VISPPSCNRLHRWLSHLLCREQSSPLQLCQKAPPRHFHPPNGVVILPCSSSQHSLTITSVPEQLHHQQVRGGSAPAPPPVNGQVHWHGSGRLRSVVEAQLLEGSNGQVPLHNGPVGLQSTMSPSTSVVADSVDPSPPLRASKARATTEPHSPPRVDLPASLASSQPTPVPVSLNRQTVCPVSTVRVTTSAIQSYRDLTPQSKSSSRRPPCDPVPVPVSVQSTTHVTPSLRTSRPTASQAFAELTACSSSCAWSVDPVACRSRVARIPPSSSVDSVACRSDVARSPSSSKSSTFVDPVACGSGIARVPPSIQSPATVDSVASGSDVARIPSSSRRPPVRRPWTYFPPFQSRRTVVRGRRGCPRQSVLHRRESHNSRHHRS